MDINGTTHGAYARMYPSFSYVMPICREITFHEDETDLFPQIDRVDLLDYSFRVIEGKEGRTVFQLWLIPHEGTQAKEETQICEVTRYGWPEVTIEETNAFFKEMYFRTFVRRNHKESEIRCSS